MATHCVNSFSSRGHTLRNRSVLLVVVSVMVCIVFGSIVGNAYSITPPQSIGDSAEMQSNQKPKSRSSKVRKDVFVNFDNDAWSILPEVGYIATALIGNNPASQPIVGLRGDTLRPTVIGSGIVSGQSGFRLGALFNIGSRFILPAHFEMTFVSGSQRQDGTEFRNIHRYDNSIASLVTGIQYRIIDLPLANAFMYAGIDIRASYIGAGVYSLNSYDRDTFGIISPTPNPSAGIENAYKESTVRLGSAFRIGAQGTIIDKLRINMSGTIGAFNVVGRDSRVTGSRRGELLTPSTLNETNEQLSYFVQFGMSLVYIL